MPPLNYPCTNLSPLAHRCPGTQYVINGGDELADFQRTGALAELHTIYLSEPLDAPARQHRRASAVERFDWESLKQSYLAAFHQAGQIRPIKTSPTTSRRDEPLSLNDNHG